MKARNISFLLGFSVFCVGAQAQRFPNLGNINLNAVTGAASALKPISEKEEIDIGRDLAGRLLGQVQLVDDASVQAYVNRVGRWIASQSERPDLPWRFGVANAANVNAMAMPGGTILITRGLYDMLDNEAQLAGVLGHEIAHVVKRHHISVMQKQNFVQAGASLAQARTGSNVLGQVALDFFRNLFISGLDKDSEYEADAVGAILAARAGYNAFGLAEVMHKLAARSDASTADLFGSHPGPRERLEKLGEVLEKRLANLPIGLEPEITPVSASAAAPTAGATASSPGARGFTSEAGRPAASAPAGAQQAAPSGGGVNPADMIRGLKGLFGR
jgi:predicted Zn-dependent protease